MIERIVENWLISASERSYQLAFCQLLAAEGEELLYIATHAAFEKGKDVITRTKDGKIRAYQLKSKNVRLAQWREIQSQINDLVELPVNIPQCPGNANHFPYFVTNGYIHDAVLDNINTANLSWRNRKYPHPLVSIERSQLVHRFTKIHGTYLPQEAKDFQQFLALLLADGTGPIDKPVFATFIESLIPFKDGTSHLKVSRALSSAVLLTSYIMGSATSCGNHWAIFEAWTMMASYILAAATKFSLPDKMFRASYELAMLGATRAQDALVAECKITDHFLSNDPMVDGFFYASRQLILSGTLAVWALIRRRAKQEVDQQVKSLVFSRVKHAFVWGESASPFVLFTALEIEQQCVPLAAENLVLEYLQLLVSSHGENRRGLPDSFIGIEDSIRFMHGIGEPIFESFRGFSHSCKTVIDFLSRRLRRVAISGLWAGISRISLDSSVPQHPWEWFFWHSDSAMLISTIPGQPQSWSTLIAESESRDVSRLPSLMRADYTFILFFLLVFPHWLTPETFAVVENFIRTTD